MTDKDVKANVRTKLATQWSRFAEDTTLHGCKQVQNNKKPKCFRFLWATLLVMMIATFVTAMVMLWVQYSSHPFRTVWKLSRESSLILPEISVCLRGEYDTGKGRSWDAAEDYMKFRWINDWSNSSNEFLHLPYSEAESRFAIAGKEVVMGLYSYDLTAFKKLPTEDWLTRYPMPGRSCWSLLKRNFDSNGVEHQFRLEMLKSIMIVLNPMTSRLEKGHTAVGIEVFFHQAGTTHWFQNGVSLVPGAYADVRFKHERTKFLPLPYESAGSGGCVDTEDPTFINPLKFHNTYSFDLCVQELLIDRLHDQCGCLFQPFASTLKVKECTVLKFHVCFLTVQSQVLSDALKPDSNLCIESCENLNYVTTLSYSALDSESIKPYLSSPNGTNISVMLEADLKNFIFIQIQPLSLDVNTVEHVPEMTLLDIFAQIGGCMGLFLGASLMTWMEIFDVAMQMVWVYLSTVVRRLRGET
ncbi:hypothetical protein EGW08_005958 [Elysia chlorotica]|uniref:Uncharacterized protein n=1 Tax=Elysia chlorotica TaxID=188477 RepID=A0A3S1BQH0_ELYCH|nr:hypothetical protein EGW08_005958 [Elysia chlorotica]